MRNARRFDERITIGSVPDGDDLKQLKELGYKTLVDLREEEEKFGGLVQKRATDLGLRYVSIPIRREAIRMEDVSRFYDTVYEKGSAPIYAFSRFGKKPLAFLLLLEVVARDEHLPMIFRKASRFGLHLQGDEVLQQFLVDIYNSGNIRPILESIQKHRPDLFHKPEKARTP
jgi:protein tyrosine phosphatase (PTP) superfamily phosphohydrolase (DUF442 family)